MKDRGYAPPTIAELERLFSDDEDSLDRFMGQSPDDRYTTSVTPAENPQVTTGVEKGLKRDYTGRLIGNKWGASVVGDAYIGS